MDDFPFSGLTTDVDAVPVVDIGAGCTRRDLPSAPGVRVWVVDIAPGAAWPSVDLHTDAECVFVVSGTLVEAGREYPPGTYVRFDRGSSHRPSSPDGVRLFGVNYEPRSPDADRAELGRRSTGAFPESGAAPTNHRRIKR